MKKLLVFILFVTLGMLIVTSAEARSLSRRSADDVTPLDPAAIGRSNRRIDLPKVKFDSATGVLNRRSAGDVNPAAIGRSNRRIDLPKVKFDTATGALNRRSAGGVNPAAIGRVNKKLDLSQVNLNSATGALNNHSAASDLYHNLVTGHGSQSSALDVYRNFAAGHGSQSSDFEIIKQVNTLVCTGVPMVYKLEHEKRDEDASNVGNYVNKVIWGLVDKQTKKVAELEKAYKNSNNSPEAAQKLALAKAALKDITATAMNFGYATYRGCGPWIGYFPIPIPRSRTGNPPYAGIIELQRASKKAYTAESQIYSLQAKAAEARARGDTELANKYETEMWKVKNETHDYLSNLTAHLGQDWILTRTLQTTLCNFDVATSNDYPIPGGHVEANK